MIHENVTEIDLAEGLEELHNAAEQVNVLIFMAAPPILGTFTTYRQVINGLKRHIDRFVDKIESRKIMPRIINLLPDLEKLTLTMDAYWACAGTEIVRYEGRLSRPRICAYFHKLHHDIAEIGFSTTLGCVQIQGNQGTEKYTTTSPPEAPPAKKTRPEGRTEDYCRNQARRDHPSTNQGYHHHRRAHGRPQGQHRSRGQIQRRGAAFRREGM